MVIEKNSTVHLDIQNAAILGETPGFVAMKHFLGKQLFNTSPRALQFAIRDKGNPPSFEFLQGPSEHLLEGRIKVRHRTVQVADKHRFGKKFQKRPVALFRLGADPRTLDGTFP